MDAAVELLAETEDDFAAARRAVESAGCLATAESQYAQLAARNLALDGRPRRRVHFRA